MNKFNLILTFYSDVVVVVVVFIFEMVNSRIARGNIDMSKHFGNDDSVYTIVFHNNNVKINFIKESLMINKKSRLVCCMYVCMYWLISFK